VPVGEDQVPHVEITREIARRFNSVYGQVFPEPEPLLTKFSPLPGLDGNAKMSKSLGNAVLLSDDPEIVKAKIKKAVTDPQKIRKGDPGNPDICLIFAYHKKFNPGEVLEIEAGCRSGALGCVDCKMNCASKISMFLEPIREKRKYYEERIDEVKSILNDGEQRAKKAAQSTMAEVHEKMRMG
ncbi:MAG: tryptophan--tRNA ligase, partial [Ignavibacteria bacterium]